MSSIGVNDLPFLDGYLYRVMLDLLRTEGTDTFGLYSYYEVRIEKGRCAFSAYDRMLFEYVLGSFDPGERRIVHAGIGLGTLTSALAAGGYGVAGIEQDGQRLRGAGRLHAALAQAWPDAGKRYELIAGQYPKVVEGTSWLTPATVLIFTNCGAGWSQELTDQIIDSFAMVGDVILDARLFGITRDDEKDRRALIERIESRGFTTRLVAEPPADGFYYHVRTHR